VKQFDRIQARGFWKIALDVISCQSLFFGKISQFTEDRGVGRDAVLEDSHELDDRWIFKVRFSYLHGGR
jgi:hypothetical protein